MKAKEASFIKVSFKCLFSPLFLQQTICHVSYLSTNCKKCLLHYAINITTCNYYDDDDDPLIDFLLQQIKF
jgi:hypothetical protein